MKTIVLLAAGSSSRLGRTKQLLAAEGEPLVRHMARVALAAKPDRVIVVVNTDDAVRNAITDLDVDIAVNDRAEEGIASSIRMGVAMAVNSDVVIMLCDQPRIPAEHLRALMDVDAPIAATGYEGIAGVPAFFAGEFRNQLLGLRGDRGARLVIDANRDRVVVVDCPAAAVDIDVEEDCRYL